MVLRIFSGIFYSNFTRFSNVAVILVIKTHGSTYDAATLVATGNFRHFTFLATKYTQCELLVIYISASDYFFNLLTFFNDRDKINHNGE